MVLLKRREIELEPLKILRIGGYVVLFGVFIGVTFGVYALFNPPLFLILINISQYEAPLFFSGVYLPGFVIIVALGYVFATIPKLERLTLWRIAALCTLILLCLALSALSIFNLLSLLGGFLVLTALILAYTKPTFKALWKREACFFVETGTMLIASSSMLYLLMWVISRFFHSYSMGVYEASYSYPYILLVIGILSLLTFFVTPILCLHGDSKWLCGILSLTVNALSFVTIIHQQYVYFNLSAYLGAFLAGVGTILTFCGSLIYIKLSLFGATSPPPILEPSLRYQGYYCPYCGEPWMDSDQDFCSACGENLKKKLKTSFCPYCGRLVSEDFRNCPHCKEDIWSLPIYVSLRKREEEIGPLKRRLGKLPRVLEIFLEYTNMTFKDFVYVCILTFLFAFLSFLGYVRTEPAAMSGFIIAHYGFPFECVEALYEEHGFSYSLVWGSVKIIWVALILDFISYFLLAFAIVYGITRLKS